MSNPVIKTKTSKQLKMDLLDSVGALGGKNKIIETIKADMAKGDNSSFWNLIRTCSSFVPKDMNITGGEGLIALTLQIPRPDSEYDKLPEHVTVEGEVVSPNKELSTDYTELSTACPQPEPAPVDKEGSIIGK